MKFSLSIFGCALLCFFVSCKNDAAVKADHPSDSTHYGTIYISVDETFKPVIQEEIRVYESSFPDAHIIADYKSEADCLRDLQNDSTRMIIVAQDVTTEQSRAYQQKLNYRLQWDKIAYDAVSAIINIESPDSVFTLKKLKQLLTDSSAKTNIVVDGNNATSTVRYLIDTLLEGKKLGNNVKAVNGSRAVIEYVAKDKNALGFVGSSWVGNDEDTQQVADQKRIKFALLECKYCTEDSSVTFAKPSQESIRYMWYPLVRPLFYILKENFTGLGTGFVNFLTLERGQLIFKRSYLVPAKMNFDIRKGDL